MVPGHHELLGATYRLSIDALPADKAKEAHHEDVGTLGRLARGDGHPFVLLKLYGAGPRLGEHPGKILL